MSNEGGGGGKREKGRGQAGGGEREDRKSKCRRKGMRYNTSSTRG